jgi:transketolase
MGLEDIAMFRAVHGSTVLYPCDANQTAQLTALMADQPGIVYLRTTREKTPVLYAASEDFRVGGSRVLRQSDGDQVAIVTAGITVAEALKAYDRLKAEGITVRVIDAYSIKPIDAATLQEAARSAGGKILTVEDHWPEGGLGDAVLDAFAGTGQPLPIVAKVAVPDMPGSGKPADMLRWAGLDAEGIADAARKLVKG